ncbi:hypothetical protein Peur_015346 [Populus x canadensis]
MKKPNQRQPPAVYFVRLKLEIQRQLCVCKQRQNLVSQKGSPAPSPITQVFVQPLGFERKTWPLIYPRFLS